MPDRRGATLLEDLPGELIDMILVRLPSKAVGRCRVVSPSWRSATSTSEFMLEHRRRQPLLPIINGQGRPASFVVLSDAGAKESSQQLWPFLPGIKNHSKHDIRASCDGFLIRYDRSLSRYYICNPVICKEVLLPWPQVGEDISNNVVGFYRHHPTGEYRVLWVSSSVHISKCSLYALAVGSNEPRHVTVTMPAGSSPSVEQKLLKGLHSPRPVHHNGSLHWCPYFASDIMGDGGDIIVFDTEAESFRSMRSPCQTGFRRKLFSMKGTLAFWGMSTPGSTDIDVWVMEDYEADIWALKYRIDLSKVEASRQLYSTASKQKNKRPPDSLMYGFSDMVVLNERELLIMTNYKLVFRCDVDGKFLGMVKIGKLQYRMMLTHHLLQESIIPIPSQEMQG
ncbi:unnamed protein product [Alopecurus aequalis]